MRAANVEHAMLPAVAMFSAALTPCSISQEASSAQAHAIAAGLDLAPNSIAAVNTGRLQLGPCAA